MDQRTTKHARKRTTVRATTTSQLQLYLAETSLERYSRRQLQSETLRVVPAVHRHDLQRCQHPSVDGSKVFVRACGLRADETTRATAVGTAEAVLAVTGDRAVVTTAVVSNVAVAVVAAALAVDGSAVALGGTAALLVVDSAQETGHRPQTHSQRQPHLPSVQWCSHNNHAPAMGTAQRWGWRWVVPSSLATSLAASCTAGGSALVHRTRCGRTTREREGRALAWRCAETQWQPRGAEEGCWRGIAHAVVVTD